jgi:hypothetical protein
MSWHLFAVTGSQDGDIEAASLSYHDRVTEKDPPVLARAGVEVGGQSEDEIVAGHLGGCLTHVDIGEFLNNWWTSGSCIQSHTCSSFILDFLP